MIESGPLRDRFFFEAPSAAFLCWRSPLETKIGFANGRRRVQRWNMADQLVCRVGSLRAASPGLLEDRGLPVAGRVAE